MIKVKKEPIDYHQSITMYNETEYGIHNVNYGLVCKIPLLARRTRPKGRARRATIGYLVYKLWT